MKNTKKTKMIKSDYEKYLVVSIHDVTPKFKSELSEIVSELGKIGIKKRSFMVIPNYLGKSSISNDRGFVEWLYKLQNNGDEIVQHGYEHISKNKNYNTPYDKFIGEKVAHGSGEFQNISYDEARIKIQKGKEIFNAIGVYAKGFVAPSWLLNPESEKAIKDEGFSYTTKFRTIEFFSQHRTEKSEVIVFTSKGIGNLYFTIHNKRLLNFNLRKRKIARVVVHPYDLHSRFFQSILKTIEQLKVGRTVTTYADLV